MKITPAAKVGLLTITALIILVFSIMWLKGRALSAGERIGVQFTDVDGMRPGSAVQMMGIRIGQVEEITPVIQQDKSYVNVKFVITEKNIEIPRASELSIQQSGIIGEKFLEITPPRTQVIYLPATANSKKLLHKDSPVEMLISGDYKVCGKVRYLEVLNKKILPLSLQENFETDYVYKIGYIITVPGLLKPDKVSGEVEAIDGGFALRLTPPDNVLVLMPITDSEYTILEPLRLKEFLDLQIETARALNETNQKINAILTEEAIMDVKTTLSNVSDLTAKASETMDNANALMKASRAELDTIMSMAEKLTDKIAVLTDNVNGILSDAEFKKTLISTTKSVNESSKRISDILSDKKTQETLNYIRVTTKNISEISTFVNDATKDKDLKKKLGGTLVNLNSSLEKLTDSLDTVGNITGSQEQSIKNIINDTSETSKNLKEFSEKLNKRFLLIRLLF